MCFVKLMTDQTPNQPNTHAHAQTNKQTNMHKCVLSAHKCAQTQTRNQSYKITKPQNHKLTNTTSHKHTNVNTQTRKLT